MLLAVFEAAGNAVEHAYAGRPRGEISIEASIEGDEVVIDIRDEGSWRSPSASGDRGRGTGLMRAVMDRVTIHRSGVGTRVELRKTITDG